MLRRHAKTIAIAAGIAYALFLGAFGAIIVFSEGLFLIGVCVVLMGALILIMAIATTFHFADRDARRRVFKEDSGAYAAISRYRRQFTNPPSTYQPAHEQHPVVVQIPSYVPPDMSDTAVIKRVREEPSAVLPPELPRPRAPKSTDVPGVDELGLTERMQREMDLRLEGFHAGQFAAEEEKKRRPPDLGPVDEEAT